jgi:hypothetical protein
VCSVATLSIDRVAVVGRGSKPEHDFVVAITEQIRVIDELRRFVFVDRFRESDPHKLRLKSLSPLPRDKEEIVLKVVPAASFKSERADPTG